MDVQPKVQGQTEEDHTMHAADGPAVPHQPVTQVTIPPPLRTLHRLWELITGPEATHWSQLLIRNHLSSRARLALSRSCTTARDLVLGAAEQASIHLHVNTNAEPNLTRLQIVERRLAARGKLRTKLVLHASDPYQLAYALGLLQLGTIWLDELRLKAHNATLPSIVLTIAARCCPNLRALTVEDPAAQLPSRQLLPKLENLTILLSSDDLLTDQGLEGLFASIGPYTQQLTRLSFLGLVTPPHTALALLLSPDNTGAHLRTLCLKNATLDATLLGLVLDGAPALGDLTVYKIQVQSHEHMYAQTQWRRLECAHLHLSSLSRLPLPPGVEIVFNVVGHRYLTFVCDAISAEQAGGARFQDVTFTLLFDPDGDWEDSISIECCGESVLVDDQPAALRVGLTLLRSWFVNDLYASMMWLKGWTMSPQLMRELPGLPRWDALDLRDESLTWLPGPESYAPLLRWLPGSVLYVCVKVAGLTQEQVENICLGAPVDRTENSSLFISLDGEPEVVEAIQDTLKDRLCGCPHVSVGE